MAEEKQFPTDEEIHDEIKVRGLLGEHFHVELSSKKKEIDKMVMEIIDNSMGTIGSYDKTDSKEDAQIENGASSSKRQFGEDDNDSDTDIEITPPHKKRRTGGGKNVKSRKNVVDSSESDDVDAEVARKLQDEELGMRRRSGKKIIEKVKEAKSKTKTGTRKGTSVYSQPCVLSDDLAEIMGANRMARKDVVSQMWKIFKERELLDPKNRQYVICDEQLSKIFKVKKFKAFGMMKTLKKHIKDASLITS